METQNNAPQRTSGLKRYGPLIAIVVVVAVIAVIVIVASRGSDDDTASTDTTSGLAASREGVVSWTRRRGGRAPPTASTGATAATPASARSRSPASSRASATRRSRGTTAAPTSTGVTGDTIKVVYYQTPDVDPVIDFITSEIKVDDTNADEAATLTGFNEMYSKYFETYGRKIDLQFYTGTGPSDDPVAARADAVTIANMEPFAVLGGPVLVPDFADELAARKVLCIGCTPRKGHQFYIDRQPYVWGVANSGEQAQTHSAEYVSKQLAGRKAEYAGDPALQQQDRKFGLIYLSTSESSEARSASSSRISATRASKSRSRSRTRVPIDLQTSMPRNTSRR